MEQEEAREQEGLEGGEVCLYDQAYKLDNLL